MEEFNRVVEQIGSELARLIQLAREANQEIDSIGGEGRANQLSQRMQENMKAVQGFVDALKYAASDNKNSGFARLEKGAERLNTILGKLDTSNITKLSKALAAQQKLLTETMSISEQQRTLLNNIMRETASAASQIANLARAVKDADAEIAAALHNAELLLQSYNFTEVSNQLGKIARGVAALDPQKFHYAASAIERVSTAIARIDSNKIEQLSKLNINVNYNVRGLSGSGKAEESIASGEATVADRVKSIKQAIKSRASAEASAKVGEEAAIDRDTETFLKQKFVRINDTMGALIDELTDTINDKISAKKKELASKEGITAEEIAAQLEEYSQVFDAIDDVIVDVLVSSSKGSRGRADLARAAQKFGQDIVSDIQSAFASVIVQSPMVKASTLATAAAPSSAKLPPSKMTKEEKQKELTELRSAILDLRINISETADNIVNFIQEITGQVKLANGVVESVAHRQEARKVLARLFVASRVKDLPEDMRDEVTTTLSGDTRATYESVLYDRSMQSRARALNKSGVTGPDFDKAMAEYQTRWREDISSDDLRYLELFEHFEKYLEQQMSESRTPAGKPNSVAENLHRQVRQFISDAKERASLDASIEGMFSLKEFPELETRGQIIKRITDDKKASGQPYKLSDIKAAVKAAELEQQTRIKTLPPGVTVRADTPDRVRLAPGVGADVDEELREQLRELRELETRRDLLERGGDIKAQKGSRSNPALQRLRERKTAYQKLAGDVKRQAIPVLPYSAEVGENLKFGLDRELMTESEFTTLTKNLEKANKLADTLNKASNSVALTLRDHAKRLNALIKRVKDGDNVDFSAEVTDPSAIKSLLEDRMDALDQLRNIFYGADAPFGADFARGDEHDSEASFDVRRSLATAHGDLSSFMYGGISPADTTARMLAESGPSTWFPDAPLESEDFAGMLDWTTKELNDYYKKISVFINETVDEIKQASPGTDLTEAYDALKRSLNNFKKVYRRLLETPFDEHEEMFPTADEALSTNAYGFYTGNDKIPVFTSPSAAEDFLEELDLFDEIVYAQIYRATQAIQELTLRAKESGISVENTISLIEEDLRNLTDRLFYMPIAPNRLRNRIAEMSDKIDAAIMGMVDERYKGMADPIGFMTDVRDNDAAKLARLDSGEPPDQVYGRDYIEQYRDRSEDILRSSGELADLPAIIRALARQIDNLRSDRSLNTDFAGYDMAYNEVFEPTDPARDAQLRDQIIQLRRELTLVDRYANGRPADYGGSQFVSRTRGGLDFSAQRSMARQVSAGNRIAAIDTGNANSNQKLGWFGQMLSNAGKLLSLDQVADGLRELTSVIKSLDLSSLRELYDASASPFKNADGSIPTEVNRAFADSGLSAAGVLNKLSEEYQRLLVNVANVREAFSDSALRAVEEAFSKLRVTAEWFSKSLHSLLTEGLATAFDRMDAGIREFNRELSSLSARVGTSMSEQEISGLRAQAVSNLIHLGTNALNMVNIKQTPVITGERANELTPGNVRHRDNLSYVDNGPDSDSVDRREVNTRFIEELLSRSSSGMAVIANAGSPTVGSVPYQVEEGIEIALDHVMFAIRNKLGGIDILSLSPGPTVSPGNTTGLTYMGSDSLGTESNALVDRALVGAPVNAGDEATLTRLVAELSRAVAPGNSYSILAEVGATCASAAAEAVTRANLDRGVTNIPVGGLNTIVPGDIIDLFARGEISSGDQEYATDDLVSFVGELDRRIAEFGERYFQGFSLDDVVNAARGFSDAPSGLTDELATRAASNEGAAAQLGQLRSLLTSRDYITGFLKSSGVETPDAPGSSSTPDAAIKWALASLTQSKSLTDYETALNQLAQNLKGTPYEDTVGKQATSIIGSLYQDSMNDLGGKLQRLIETFFSTPTAEPAREETPSPVVQRDPDLAQKVILGSMAQLSDAGGDPAAIVRALLDLGDALDQIDPERFRSLINGIGDVRTIMAEQRFGDLMPAISNVYGELAQTASSISPQKASSLSISRGANVGLTEGSRQLREGAVKEGNTPFGGLMTGLANFWDQLAAIPTHLMSFSQKMILAVRSANDTLEQANSFVKNNVLFQIYENMQRLIKKVVDGLADAIKLQVIKLEVLAEDVNRANAVLSKTGGVDYIAKVAQMISDIVRIEGGKQLGMQLPRPASSNPADWGAPDTRQITVDPQTGIHRVNTKDVELTPEQRAAINWKAVAMAVDASEQGIAIFSATSSETGLGHSVAAMRGDDGEIHMRHYRAIGASTVDHDFQDKDYETTGIMVDPILEAVPVKGLSDEEAKKLRAEINRKTEGGQTYSFTHDLATAVGDTCSSAMTEAFNRAGVIPTTVLPARTGAINTATPVSLIDAIASRNAAVANNESLTPENLRLRFDSDKIGKLTKVAESLAPLRHLADVSDDLAVAFNELIKDLVDAEDIDSAKKAAATFAQRTERHIPTDSLTQIRNLVGEVASLAVSTTEKFDTKTAERLSRALADVLPRKTSPALDNADQAKLYIAETIGALITTNPAIDTHGAEAYNALLSGGDVTASLDKYVTGLAQVKPEFATELAPMVNALKTVYASGDWKQLTKALEDLSNKIYALSVNGIVTTANAAEDPTAQPVDAEQLNTARSETARVLSALKSSKTGWSPFDEAGKTVSTGIYFMNQIGMMKNGIAQSILALKELNPGTVVDLAGGIMKFFGGIQNMGYTATGGDRNGKGNILGLSSYRPDRANTWLSIIDLIARTKGDKINWEEVQSTMKEWARDNGYAFLAGDPAKDKPKADAATDTEADKKTKTDAKTKKADTKVGMGQTSVVTEATLLNDTLEQFFKRWRGSTPSGDKDAAIKEISAALLSGGKIDYTSAAFRNLWAGDKKDSELKAIAEGIQGNFNARLKESGFDTPGDKDGDMSALKAEVRSAAARASESGLNAMLSGRNANDPATAVTERIILKNMSEDELTRTKSYEEGLYRLFKGTGFERIITEGGYVVANAASIVTMVKDLFGETSSQYKEAVALAGSGGDLSGLAMRLPGDVGGYKGNMAFSVIGGARDDMSAAETSIHEMIHLATKARAATNPNIFASVDPLSRRNALESDEGIRNASLKAASDVSDRYKNLVAQIGNDLDYFLDPQEILSNVGQAFIAGNKELSAVFKHIYGEELYNRAITVLESELPDLFSADSRALIRARMPTFNSQQSGSVAAQNIPITDHAQNAAAVLREMVSGINNQSLLAAADILTADDVTSSLGNALARSIYDSGSLLERIGGDIVMLPEVRAAFRNFLATGSVDALRQATASLQKVAMDRVLKDANWYSENPIVVKFAEMNWPSISRNLTTEAGVALGAQTGIGKSQYEYFDDADALFRKRTGEGLSRRDFSVQESYDVESGQTKLSISARTASGATTQLAGSIDKLGKVSFETEKKGLQRMIGRFRDELAQEIPEEIIEEMLYGVIGGLQQLFSQIMTMQDEIAQVEILMGGASYAGDVDPEANARNLVFEAIEIASVTGQGFEESVQTLINSFKSLGSITPGELRESAAKRLSVAQLGSQTVFGLSLEQSMESIPAIFAQLRDMTMQANPGMASNDVASLAMDQMDKVLDQMVVAQRETGANAKDLMMVYSRLSASAKDIGLDPKKLIALSAASSTKLGLGPEETANSLKFFIERLYSREGIQSMRQYGVSVQELDPESGKVRYRSLDRVMDEINAVTARTPELAKVIGQELGGRARSGEVSAILSSRAEARRTEGALDSKVNGTEFETEVARRSDNFVGSINTVKANVGNFINTVLFSSGVLEEFGANFEKISGLLSTMAGWLNKNEGALDVIKNLVVNFGEALLFVAINGGKVFLRLVDIVNKMGLSYRNVINDVANKAIFPESSAKRSVDAVRSVIAEMESLQKSGRLTEEIFEQMANRIARAMSTIGLSVDHLRTAVNTAYAPNVSTPATTAKPATPATTTTTNLAKSPYRQSVPTATSPTSYQASTRSVMGGIARARSAPAVVAAAVTAAGVPDPAAAAAALSAQKASVAVTKASTKAKVEEINRLREVTGTLSFFKRVLDGASKRTATGVSDNALTRSPALAGAGQALFDIAPMVLADVALKGNPLESVDSAASIGVGIGGAIAGTLLSGGNPVGTIMGYQMAQALSDTIDIPGMLGTSGRELGVLESSFAKALADTKKYEGMTPEEIDSKKAEEETKRKERIAAARQTLKDKFGIFEGSELAQSGLKVSDIEKASKFDPKMAEYYRNYNPAKEAMGAALGGAGFGGGTAIQGKLDTQAMLQEYDVLQKYPVLLEYIKANAEELGNVSVGEFISQLLTNDDLLERVGVKAEDLAAAWASSQEPGQNWLTTVEDELESVNKTIDKVKTNFQNLTQLPSADNLIQFGPAGTAYRDLNTRFQPYFDGIASGAIGDDAADSIYSEYDRQQQVMGGIPALAAKTDYLEQYLPGDQFGDVEQMLVDIGVEGQAAFGTMVDQILEAISVVDEYEATLAGLNHMLEVQSSYAAGTDEYKAAQASIDGFREKLSLMGEQYNLQLAFLGALGKEPSLITAQTEAMKQREESRKKREAARRARESKPEFRMPSLVDVEGYEAGDLQEALGAAKAKQAQLVRMFPAAAKEFASEQFMLDAGGQMRGVTGVSQSFFQDALSEIKGRKAEKLQAPNMVDFSDKTPEQINKILSDARAMQNQAVALAPDLAGEYKDERLLIMQKNNQLLMESGLSQEYLQAAIEANTESTDENTLRGHYNLPGSYRAPTIWDYYNDGGTEAGSENFVPPPGGGSGMVPLDLATSIANAVLADGQGGDETIIPDLAGLTGLVDPNAQPLGYPDKIEVTYPDDFDTITTDDLIVNNTDDGTADIPPIPYNPFTGDDKTGKKPRTPEDFSSLPPMLRDFGSLGGGGGGGGASSPEDLSSLPPRLRDYGSLGKGGSTAVPEDFSPLPPDLKGFSGLGEGGAAPKPDDFTSLPPSLKDFDKLVSDAGGAAGKSKTKFDEASASTAGFVSTLTSASSIVSTASSGINTNTVSMNSSVGSLTTSTGLFGKAVTTLMSQFKVIDVAGMLANMFRAGNVSIVVNGQQATIKTDGGAANGGRGGSGFVAGPGTGNTRV